MLQLGDANGKAKTALEQTRQNLERTAEELRKAHPDVEQKATALRDQLQAAVQSTVQVRRQSYTVQRHLPNVILNIQVINIR